MSAPTSPFDRPARARWLGAALIAALLIANVILSYHLFTRPFPGFNDYTTPWEAARAFFYDGVDPYSAEASLSIQMRLYGRPALPDEQPNHFAYPFYALFLAWPLIHFDYAWATAVWLVVNETALIGAVALLLDFYDWRPRPLTLAAVLLLAILAYPAARGLILGQVSHAVYFLQVLALWALARRRDRLAGAALALATLKPQMSLFLVPFLLLWGLAEHRRRFVAAFALTFAALLGLSFALLPDWPAGFYTQLTLYPSYIEVSTPAWVIASYLLNLGRGAELALNALGLAALLWAWYMAIVRHRERFWWTVMLTLTITHLIGLRTATPHFIVFMIPLVFWLRELAQRGQGVLMAALLLTLFALPWLHFLFTIGTDRFEHPTTFLPLPLLTLAALWFTRHRWWRAQPPV